MTDNQPAQKAETTEERSSLEQRIAKDRKRLWDIEAAERFEKAKKLQGKCFRFRNSYSCPNGEKDRWWLYMRVIDVTKDGFLTVFSFQTDKDGQHTIEPEKKRMYESNLGDPLTPKQFRHAWKILVKRVNHSARVSGACP